jgi:hypothetical protein
MLHGKSHSVVLGLYGLLAVDLSQGMLKKMLTTLC